MADDFGARADFYRARVSHRIHRALHHGSAFPQRLHEAMVYAADGGKRLRPLLVYASAETLGLTAAQVDAPAAAVELIHAYSLVHDDLPAMDNDDLRRGRPTCHRAYDEATAILVGDALQAAAFRVLAETGDGDASAEARVAMVRELAEAAGSHGMVGGQAVDLDAVGRDLGVAEIEAMHIRKTGALLLACVRMAALASDDCDSAQSDALEAFGKRIGLAFQIQDDVLDESGDTDVIGKHAGQDRRRGKPTYVSAAGLSAAAARADELFGEALSALQPFGDAAAPLRWIAESLRARRH